METQPTNRVPTTYDQNKQMIDVVNGHQKIAIGAFEPCYIQYGRTRDDSVFGDRVVAWPILTQSGEPQKKDEDFVPINNLGSLVQVAVNGAFPIGPGASGSVSQDWPLIARVTDEVPMSELNKRPLYPGTNGFVRHKAFWPDPKIYGPNCTWWALHEVKSDNDFPLAMITQTAAIAESSLNIVSAMSEWFSPTGEFKTVEMKRFPSAKIPVNEIANFYDKGSEIELLAPGLWDIYVTVKVKSVYTGENPVEQIPGYKLMFALDPNPELKYTSSIDLTGDERTYYYPVVGLVAGGSSVYVNDAGLLFQIGNFSESYGINFVVDTRILNDEAEKYRSPLSCRVEYFNTPAQEIELAVRMLVVFRSIATPGV